MYFTGSLVETATYFVWQKFHIFHRKLNSLAPKVRICAPRANNASARRCAIAYLRFRNFCGAGSRLDTKLKIQAPFGGHSRVHMHLYH